MTVKMVTPYGEDTLDSLNHRCRTCDLCGLSETRTQVVVGSGVVPSPLMLIGEGPGEQEDETGVPFVGKAGQLLTKILESAGIQRETDCFITNIVKCRPPKNRAPQVDEIVACSGYLWRQVELVQPRIMVLLGSVALKSVLGHEVAISKVRGQWQFLDVGYMSERLYVMPMFHPSYLLRNQSREPGSPKWLTWKDIQEVKIALDFYKQQ